MYRKTREMIIVPDETQVNIPEYRKELLKKEDRHGYVVKEFSDLYHLGLTFQTVQVEEGNYNGYKWGVALAKLGHLGIQKDDNIVFYLPDVITDSQYQYLKSHKKEYSIYQNDMGIIDVRIEQNQFLVDSIDQLQIIEDEKLINILDDIIEEKHKTEIHKIKG